MANPIYDDVPNPKEIEGKYASNQTELEQLRKKYIGSVGQNPNKIPEHQQWIGNKNVSDSEQLRVLKAWDKARTTGNYDEYNKQYDRVQQDHLKEFAGKVQDVAGYAAPLTKAKPAVALGRTALETGKKVFGDKASDTLKSKAEMPKTEKTFEPRTGENIGKTEAAAEEATMAEKPFSSKSQRMAERAEAESAAEEVTAAEKPFNPKLRNIQKGEMGDALDNLDEDNPNYPGAKSPFKSNPLSTFAAAALFGGLIGKGLDKVQKTFNPTSKTGESRNELESILSSSPSGGDSGMVGESHFGSESIGGKTVLEVLSKIYQILNKQSDSILKVATNTSTLVRIAMKADEKEDIRSANLKARANEGEGGVIGETSIISAGGSSSEPESSSGGGIVPVGKPKSPSSSSFWKKLAGRIKKLILPAAAAVGAGSLLDDSEYSEDPNISDSEYSKTGQDNVVPGQEFSGVGSNDSAQKAMDFFIKKGWTKEQAAGIVGNLQQESGNFNPDVISGKIKGDNGTAVGTAQWRGDRQTGFEKKYGKKLEGSTLEEQLEYIQYELTEGGKKKAGEKLRATTTAAEAASIVDKDYEVSAGTERGQRMANAEALLNPDKKLYTIPTGTLENGKSVSGQPGKGESGRSLVDRLLHRNEDYSFKETEMQQFGLKMADPSSTKVIKDAFISGNAEYIEKPEHAEMQETTLPQDKLKIVEGGELTSSKEPQIIPESELFKQKELIELPSGGDFSRETTTVSGGGSHTKKVTYSKDAEEAMSRKDKAYDEFKKYENDRIKELREKNPGMSISDAKKALEQDVDYDVQKNSFEQEKYLMDNRINAGRTEEESWQNPPTTTRITTSGSGKPLKEEILQNPKSNIPEESNPVEDLSKSVGSLAKAATSNSGQSQQPIPPASPKPPSSGKGGKMMKVRNDDPIILQMQWDNIRSA